ncbi:MAG: hypothetical protein DMF53_24395 [Acidobacteria bacterium]|nr:MAG: hypothetical protein DMF53_24395 [Acidobacteriota bacterium]
MRKFSAIALVSCLTLGATAAFAAQTSTTPSTSMDKPAASGTMSKTTKTTTATSKSTKTTAKAHKVTGDITAVDCTTEPKNVTIGTTQLYINSATKITVKGKKVDCDDLKKDMKATASYTEKDGKNWAKYISAK